MKITNRIVLFAIALILITNQTVEGQSIALDFKSTNDLKLINTQLNGFNMGPSFNEIFTASSVKEPIKERCLFGKQSKEYRIVSMKANHDFVEKSAELKPSVLRFPGGTIANYYHLYEYTSGKYDPNSPVYARGFGTQDVETKSYPQSNVIRKQYCLDDILIELEDQQENPNYINGFSNYINQLETKVRSKGDSDYKVDVIFVANVLTHFDFKYLLSTPKRQFLTPSDPSDILNIKEPNNQFELYYKETIDAIRFLKSRSVNVVGVEFGNELYFGVYENNNNITPQKYMDLCQIYSARIKNEFPNMKVAIVSDTRIPKWDKVLASHSPSFFDAVVLHDYYNNKTCLESNNSGDQDCANYLNNRECRFDCGKYVLDDFLKKELIDDLENALSRYPKNKKIWMTEWGIITPKNTKANNLDYLNTFLYASFTSEHLLQQLQFNQTQNNRLEYSTHHRIGYKIDWSVIQMELGNTESIKRSNFYSYEILKPVFEGEEVSLIGKVIEQDINHHSDFYAKTFIIHNQGELPELYLYYSNKTKREIKLTPDFLSQNITLRDKKYKLRDAATSSYLMADEKEGLYASFGKTKFNKERYDKTIAPTLEYLDRAEIDLRSYHIPGFSTGYIKISLEKSTAVDPSDPDPIRQIAYPNPVGDYLYINAGLEQGPSAIHVFDTNGRELQLRQNYINGVIQLETSSLCKGVFFVQLNNQMKNSVYRFMKE